MKGSSLQNLVGYVGCGDGGVVGDVVRDVADGVAGVVVGGGGWVGVVVVVVGVRVTDYDGGADVCGDCVFVGDVAVVGDCGVDGVGVCRCAVVVAVV